jgi:hypothetical protein
MRPLPLMNGTHSPCRFIFTVWSDTPRSRIRVVVSGPGAPAGADAEGTTGALRPAFTPPSIDRSLLSPKEGRFFEGMGEVTSIDDNVVSVTIRMNDLKPALQSHLNDADTRQFFNTFPDALPSHYQKTMVSNTLATDQSSLRDTWEGLFLEASRVLVLLTRPLLICMAPPFVLC